MSIAEKLTAISENVGKVFDAGYAKGKSEGHIEPSGTIKIEENGTYNVYEFADAFVNVPTYEAENERLTEEITQLSKEIAELNEEIAYNEQRILELQSENDGLVGTIQFLQDKVEGLNATIAEKQARIAELEALVAELEAQRPSGSISIKANGTYDVTDKATAVVDVPSDGTLAESLLKRTITELNDSEITTIGSYALSYCNKLTSVNLTACYTIGAYAFYGCTALKNVYIRAGIGTNYSVAAFYNCTALEHIDVLLRTASVGDFSSTFRGCSSLKTLIIRNDYVPKLSATNTFQDTPISNGTGYVYVPDNLVDSYKIASNWAMFADQIKPISELGE